METLLRQNQALHRLLTREDVLLSHRASFQTASLLTAVPSPPDDFAPGPRARFSSTSVLFEGALSESRVYRRIKRDSLDVSIRSSVARTHAWSIFSGLSIGDISNISVLALPVYSNDINNPQHYAFHHNEPEAADKALISEPSVVDLASIIYECMEMEMQLSQLSFYPYWRHITLQRKELGKNADSLSVLMAVFRCGDPLLALLRYLPQSKQQVNINFSQPELRPKPADWDGWVEVDELRSCLASSHFADYTDPSTPSTASDLMLTSMENQVKVCSK